MFLWADLLPDSESPLGLWAQSPAQFPSPGSSDSPQKNWGLFMSAFPATQVLGQVGTHLGSLLETSLGYRVQRKKNFFLSNKTFSLMQILADPIHTMDGRGRPTQIGDGGPGG